MKESILYDACWYRALTLRERAALLAKQPADVASADVARAEGILEAWRAQRPFCSGSLFRERVEAERMTEQELLRILAQPGEEFRTPPEWLKDIDIALQSPGTEAVHDCLETWPLLKPFRPLIDAARERLRNNIRALVRNAAATPFDPRTIEGILLQSLPFRLSQVVCRTVVLELNVARLSDQLHGDTPEQRFHSFLDILGRSESLLKFLREYPVLARQVSVVLDQWIDFSTEFLSHLMADEDDLRRLFRNGAELGVLQELEGGVGDSHRGGRSVRIARFSSGLRVVYKPRSVAVEQHFQELLTWLNQRGGSFAPGSQWFRTLTVADRGDHGWIEFVEAESCQTRWEIGRFYRRQGGYLALLYALEAVDFHYENLVAAGEYPVLIDLEALFHPRMPGESDRSAAAVAADKMKHSVTRSGLLPRRVLASDESEGLDVGGLSSTDGQFTPLEVPVWEDVATDSMRITRKRIALTESRNRPRLAGSTVDLLDYAGEIVNGFAHIYRLLQEHRQELLAQNGPVCAFEQDEVRVILRPTMTYFVLLDESCHPDVLQDAVDRERLLDRLWLAAETLPWIKRIVSAERQDLLRGDIPLFTTTPASKDLWSATHERFAGFLQESGMSLVQRRLNTLSETDLEHQLWFVRAALATEPSHRDRPRSISYSGDKSERPADRERLLAAARAIGDHLETLAVRGEEGDATWIGLTAVRQSYASLTPLKHELYDGLMGVALFLAQLARATREERYRALAHAALITLRKQWNDSKRYRGSIGGFAGWGGAIYGLAHLANTLERPELLDEAEALVDGLPPLVDYDKGLDLLSGSAGCICGLLALHHSLPSKRTLEAAILCGERLLETAQPAGEGIGWITRAATQPLAGLSHGAAGFSLGLLELAAATGDNRFRAAALKSITYERGLYSPELQNWPDLRDLSISGKKIEIVQTGITAWCHGAAGIGLARLRMLPHLEKAGLIDEIRTAVAATLDHGFGMNHSLCHGDFGNLELLLQAGRVLGDPALLAHVNRLVSAILDNAGKHGWTCGNALDVESPGLMTGLAGIGYQLLRVAEPDKVPSVLVLEPSRTASTAGRADAELVVAA
jgi:type 2 lantibiotic biosynthesis protein LanM